MVFFLLCPRRYPRRSLSFVSANMARSPFHQAKELIEAQYYDCAKRARHSKVVQENIPKVGQPPPPVRLARGPQMRKVIDEVCMEFARTQRLRRLEPEDAVFLLDRFSQAYGLCGWAFRNDIQFPRKTVEDLLNLFLVEFWSYS